jgi:hypothetical protein
MDEARNRLAVGVEERRGRAARRARLAQLGVPSEAVEIRRVEPVTPQSSLRDRHRPIVGGHQISTSTVLCTLGFNAVRHGASGFVTNSHCTNSRGGVEGTVFHLPDISGISNRIGVETVDPFFFTGGPCPSGKRCRYSDTAFVQRDAGVTASLGRLARPVPGSLTWNGRDNFRIVKAAIFPVLGQTLTKVGRTTGRTQGVVTATCANVNVISTNVTMLCQHQASYSSALGDSGSPVFRVTNNPQPNDVILHGIHWGSGGTFSSYGSIGGAAEMGPIKATDPSTPPPEPSCGPYPC